MYELLGICLALAALLTLNTLASLLAALLWRALQARARSWPAEARARTLFALRVFPGAMALVCVLALLVPAYIAHEPRHDAEAVSVKLGMIAAISAAGLALAVWRGLAGWLVTRRLVKDWMRNAEPIKLDGVSIPAFRLRHRFPVIAVVGAFRPRLFIADYLFDSLSRDELSAAIAHEGGHLAARDNLKRALLRVCRNALIIAPCGRSLDRAWAEAAELAADEHAARNGGSAALDLAAALIKIARLVPSGAKPAMPAGALLIGEDTGGIGYRALRLAQLAGADGLLEEARPAVASASLWISFGALLAAVAALAAHPRSLVAIHHLIEVAVSTLQ